MKSSVLLFLKALFLVSIRVLIFCVIKGLSLVCFFIIPSGKKLVSNHFSRMKKSINFLMHRVLCWRKLHSSHSSLKKTQTVPYLYGWHLSLLALLYFQPLLQKCQFSISTTLCYDLMLIVVLRSQDSYKKSAIFVKINSSILFRVGTFTTCLKLQCLFNRLCWKLLLVGLKSAETIKAEFGLSQ